MTEDERQLCRRLVKLPLRGRQISEEEFLARFPSAVVCGKVAIELLDKALDTQNEDDLDCALTVGHVFGFGPEHIDILCRLLELDWHYSHEDIVSALDMQRTPKAVEALYKSTLWIPKSLDYDDSRALAVKAIWALGKIPGTDATSKLEALAQSNDDILRENAKEQLALRHQAD